MSNNDSKKKLKVSVEEGVARSKHNRSLSDTIDALKKEGVLLDKYDYQGDEYEVETVLKASDEEWYFSAVVKHNGKEITENIELARETFQRKRVTQANKSKALWNLFVNGAAESHLHKCHAVKRRNEPSDKNFLRSKKHLFSVLGVLFVVGAGTIIYMLGPIPSIVNLITQKQSGIEKPLAEPAMPSNPDFVSIKTIEPAVQPPTVPLAPKSEVAPIPEKQVKEPEKPDHKLSSKSQDPLAIKAGSQATPEVKSDPKVQATPTAESEVPLIPESQKPLAQEQHVAEPKAPSAPAETQSKATPELAVPPVQEKPMPAPDVKPTSTVPETVEPPAQESQPPEDADTRDSQTSESARQQAPTALSPEEIQKKVKMLLKKN